VAETDKEKNWALSPPPKELQRAANPIHMIYLFLTRYTSQGVCTNVSEKNGKLHFTRDVNTCGIRDFLCSQAPYINVESERDMEAMINMGDSSWVTAALAPIISFKLQGIYASPPHITED
jgi:hypothetical protein